jgi:hypothetical protein
LKKFLLLVLLIPFLYGSDLKIEEKIYDLILHTLLPQHKTIKVWCEDSSKEQIFKEIKGVKCIDTPQKADFLLLSRSRMIDAKGLKFVTSYKLLEEDQKSAVGGFFWQKGRPNILFLRSNLEKHHIVLPSSMQEYIEDEL